MEYIVLIGLIIWLFVGIIACLNFILGFNDDFRLSKFSKNFDIKFEVFGDLILSPIKILGLLLASSVILCLLLVLGAIEVEEVFPTFIKGINQNKNMNNLTGKLSRGFDAFLEKGWNRPLPVFVTKEEKIKKLKEKIKKLEE